MGIQHTRVQLLHSMILCLLNPIVARKGLMGLDKNACSKCQSRCIRKWRARMLTYCCEGWNVIEGIENWRIVRSLSGKPPESSGPSTDRITLSHLHHPKTILTLASFAITTAFVSSFNFVFF